LHHWLPSSLRCPYSPDEVLGPYPRIDRSLVRRVTGSLGWRIPHTTEVCIVGACRAVWCSCELASWTRYGLAHDLMPQSSFFVIRDTVGTLLPFLMVLGSRTCSSCAVANPCKVGALTGLFSPQRDCKCELSEESGIPRQSVPLFHSAPANKTGRPNGRAEPSSGRRTSPSPVSRLTGP
jgi:hypothetical protein